ncbi:unnamed protein product [Linum tenue]|uniref:Smr domain-containing protein n=1 Tax=Linum tenue TaxID=586396 RepID=A0AAV0L8Z0_9ROSI|nr:unnamed protein product [Linum tenue]
MKPSKTRVKSTGWAAFDLKHREDADGQLKAGKDQYPPISNAVASLNSHGNNTFVKKSFSSLLLPAPAFPTLVDKSTTTGGNQAGTSCKSVQFKGRNLDLSIQKLKELHRWADNSLIDDVIAAADGDVINASYLLKEMCSSTNTSESMGAEAYSVYGKSPHSNGLNKGALSGETIDLAAEIANLSSTLEDALKGTSEPMNVDDATSNMKLVLQHLRSVPVEPEWEEHDIYLSHRKVAMKMMRTSMYFTQKWLYLDMKIARLFCRSASQHSRAATNAFLRKDHISARQHSLKAQADWMAAEKLNSKAAREILSIRNSESHAWKLDLHGLHASEAVQALKEHLHKIETLISLNRAPSPCKIKMNNGMVRSSSLESFTTSSGDGTDKKQVAVRHRSTPLQVITGVGNHSRGEAALPTAIRGFLSESGYRFDEARPGVISVWPKFRVR